MFADAWVDAREPSRSAGFPERRLVAKILERALMDLGVIHDSTAIKPRDVATARAWIADRDREWPYSFENCCEALGLSAEQLRKKADAMRDVRRPRLLAEGRRMKVSVPSHRAVA